MIVFFQIGKSIIFPSCSGRYSLDMKKAPVWNARHLIGHKEENDMFKKFCVAVLVVFGIAAVFYAVSDAGQREGKEGSWEKKIKWSQVPDAVRATIEKKVGDGKITEVVKKKEEGKIVYEFEVQKDGEESDLRVAEDGTYLGAEDDAGNITGSEEGMETDDRTWVDQFSVDEKNFSSTGRNDYFILEPGYQLVLQGDEEGDKVVLTITVLDETKKVGGVETRIVEERESKGGKIVEVSRNYFAVDKTTRNIYYFGEDVDMYKKGKIVNHEGSWLSGKDGARYGLAMPGKCEIGYRHYQEIAPKIAMDRAEVVSVSEVVKTPAGKFERCLKTMESSALNPSEKEYKFYAPGIGIIRDEDARLVKYGFVGR